MKNQRSFIGIVLGIILVFFIGFVLTRPNTKATTDPFQGEAASGKAFDQQVSTSQKSSPIISVLPAVDPEFRIDYGQSVLFPNQSGAIALYIKADTPDGRVQAVAWIRNNGFDPSDYEIIFTDLQGGNQ